MAPAVVRVQLDLQVPEEQLDLAHQALRDAGSPATQELDDGTVRGCFVDVASALKARDAALRFSPEARWGMGQTFWYDVEAYYAMYRPIETPRFWVGPPWRASEAKKSKTRIVVATNEMVFGDLGHPTTEAALQALEVLPLKGRTVLDAGCGTGVLSVAAKKLGAKQVLGVDVDALEPARALARAHRANVLLDPGDVQTLVGSFDVVIANMHMDHLTPLVPKLFTLFKKALVLSGFPARFRDSVLQGRTPDRVIEMNGFQAITFFKPATP